MTQPVPDARTLADLRPQLACGVADDELGPLGYVVLDRTLPSAPSGGGIRLAPDLTLAEVALVARAMTLKWGFLNIPHGGAKAGIAVSDELLRTRRAEVMTAFGRALRPLLERGVYFTGPDLGTTLADANAVRRGAGIAEERAADRDGGRATATTVVRAVREAAAHAGLELAGATVAIEGFGRVGREIGERLHALGARVVAASVHDAAVHAADGLDLAALAGRRSGGEEWLRRQSGTRIDVPELLALPVDVLVPCARPWTIHPGNVDDVRARVIVPAANAPLTAEAERTLAERGVTVMPDFVANCGGVLYPHMRHRGFGIAAFERVVETVLAQRMRRVLAAARADGEPATAVAARIAWRNFDRQAELLERLPQTGPARQLALLRHHGVRTLPARVAGELRARTRRQPDEADGTAWRWFLASTLAGGADQ